MFIQWDGISIEMKWIGILLTSMLFAACTGRDNQQPVSPSAVPTNVRIEDPVEYEREFDPIFPPDSILPIYEPFFASADEVPYLDEELIIGIAQASEAKAYPITMLNFREMVIDEIAGVPILVSW
jgi:hypothetical protein